MIVHFSDSSREIKDKIHIYRRILNKVRLLGHSFHNDWVETAWYRESNNKAPWEEITDIVDHVGAAIRNSDLLIAEASDASVFGVGYEVATALQQNKPVLVLVQKNTSGFSYAKGLKHDLLTYKEYEVETVEDIVEAFMKENTINTKDLRFNFVIDRRIYNHLRLKSFQ